MTLHDFRSGGAAKLLIKLGHDAIIASSHYTMPGIGTVAYQAIRPDEHERFVHHRGEDAYLMFAYLPEYRTKEYGKMPVFHTLQCGVRKQYSGFVFSPRMPVDVWSKDEGKMHRGVSLRMCQHCRREHSKALFGGFGELPWYEYVIKVAREGRKVMSSGYIDLWRQLSEAVREKAGWTCQQCKTKLPPPDKGVYLEVHHRDGNKSNNAEGNLVALCVRCHANVDDHHRKNYSQGPNYLKLKRYEENH